MLSEYVVYFEYITTSDALTFYTETTMEKETHCLSLRAFTEDI